MLGDELKDAKLKVHPVRPFIIVVFRICQSYIQISCRFPVTDKFLSLCPFVLFCFYCFHFLFNLCVIKLSTLQSRVQPSTNEPDIIFADTFCTLNKHVWTMVARKLSTAKSGVLADVIGPIHFRLLQSWCLLVATGCVLLSVLTLSSTLPVASSSTTLSIATGCRSLYNFYRTLLLATGCLFLQNVGFQFSQPSCRYEPPVPSCFSRVCFYQNLCKL